MHFFNWFNSFAVFKRSHEEGDEISNIGPLKLNNLTFCENMVALLKIVNIITRKSQRLSAKREH